MEEVSANTAASEASRSCRRGLGEVRAGARRGGGGPRVSPLFASGADTELPPRGRVRLAHRPGGRTASLFLPLLSFMPSQGAWRLLGWMNWAFPEVFSP